MNAWDPYLSSVKIRPLWESWPSVADLSLRLWWCLFPLMLICTFSHRLALWLCFTHAYHLYPWADCLTGNFPPICTHTHTHTDPPYCNKYFKGGKFSKQWCVSVCVFMCVVFAFLRDAGARCHICLLPFSVRFFGFSLCSSSSVLCQQFDLVVGLFELNKHWPGVLCQMKRRRSREAWIPRHSFTHIDMLSYKCMYFCVACIKMCVCVHEWTCMSVCVSVCGCARHFHKGRLI